MHCFEARLVTPHRIEAFGQFKRYAGRTHENHPVDEIGTPRGEGKRQRTAERIPDDRAARDAFRLEKRDEMIDPQVPAVRYSLRPRTVTEADEVWREYVHTLCGRRQGEAPVRPSGDARAGPVDE